MAVKVIRLKKQKKKETIIFTILCVIIILLLAINTWAVVNLIKNKKQIGSPSIVTDNQGVVGYVIKGNQITENVLTLDDEILSPGSITNSKIRLENLGGQGVYIRLSCDFELSVDKGANYEKKDFLNLIITDSVNWIKSVVDGKYYFVNTLSSKQYTDIDIKLEVKHELSQDDLYEEYKNSLYKIFINVETINANGVSLIETPEKIHEAWNK